MNNNDMSSLLNQINDMMKNNQIPDDIKNVINNIKPKDDSSENTSSEINSANSSFPDFDMETFMKMKSIMDTMKLNKNDPRANLLKSLKPYLKESRKSKVDQYIQLFNMGKVFEMMSPLGGDKQK